MGFAVRVVIAVLLLGVAAVLGVLEIVALADPVGTKMADDGDPFGDPGVSWMVHAAYLGVISALVIAAIVLLRRRRD